MLDLSSNYSLCEISLLGELKLLEILRLRRTAIRVIPDEIGQLTNLRVLDVSQSYKKYIVKPGVLSKLTWLEELYIDFHDNIEWVYNCLLDISNLKSLKTLHLKVRFPEIFPKDSCFEYLPRFVIAIGDGQTPDVNDLNPDVKRCMIIEGVKIMALMPLKKLIQVSDDIQLKSMEDMDNILPDLYEENLCDLRLIVVKNCENVSCLVVTRGRDGMMLSERKSKYKFFSQVEFIHLAQLPRLTLLWDCPHQYISFRNLQAIELYACSSLLMLFPISVAEGLINLTTIHIADCGGLVDVISGGNELVTSASEIEQTDDASETKLGMHYANIVFPRLETIKLWSLPKLESFYSGNSTIKYPSLERIEVIRCPSMKRWAYGVDDMPKINFGRTRRCINDLIALHHQTGGRIRLGTHD